MKWNTVELQQIHMQNLIRITKQISQYKRTFVQVIVALRQSKIGLGTNRRSAKTDRDFWFSLYDLFCDQISCLWMRESPRTTAWKTVICAALSTYILRNSATEEYRLERMYS